MTQIARRSWTLAEARASLEALLAAAQQEGPQILTDDAGRDVLVFGLSASADLDSVCAYFDFGQKQTPSSSSAPRPMRSGFGSALAAELAPYRKAAEGLVLDRDPGGWRELDL